MMMGKQRALPRRSGWLFVVVGAGLFLSACASLADTPACRILLTNDDGIAAPGIKALYLSLGEVCDVAVYAPAENQSGSSHSIKNMFSGITVSDFAAPDGVTGFAVHGTPAEAVIVGLALETSEGRSFDLVVSGVNYGNNAGLTNLYSGTVNAAMEALIHGVPAVAFSQSQAYEEDYTTSSTFAKKLVRQVITQGLPDGVMLNVNIPAPPIGGVAVVKTSGSTYDVDDFTLEQNDKGGRVFKPKFKFATSSEKGGDADAFLKGKITVSPLLLDRTAGAALDVLEDWDLTWDGGLE